MTLRNKKYVLVTLADANFVNQAKQLFASVYFKAGWTGDYLLLANGLSPEDLNWFKAKGIIIYECPLFPDSLAGVKIHPPIVLSKFYLFTEYFKQWRKVVFLDADIIVKASLHNLLKSDGFNAPNATTFRLKDEFTSDSKKNKLKKYNLRSKAFNTGVFVFDTDLITNQTFEDLQLLYHQIKDICLYADESILNIFFYKKWYLLPIVYNSIPAYMSKLYKLDQQNFLAVIVHFVNSVKPWTRESPYYQEWLDNLKKAERIDLNNRPIAVKKCSNIRLYFYLIYLKFRKISCFIYRQFLFVIKQFLFVNKQIGRFGLFIKKRSPKLYAVINLKRFFK
jgi:lipopolysaccharide biosynthesis glycosyltransferase